MIELKAICLTASLINCGIITNVFQNGKNLGDGIVTHAEISQTLASETGLTAYIIPKKDFEKIFLSDVFRFDISIVIPIEPDKPQPECEVGEYQFLTRWLL